MIFCRCDEKMPKNVLAKCNACIDNPCKNGGVCEKKSGRTFLCKCSAGYHGTYCEDQIDACYGEPCLNGATCKVLLNYVLKSFSLKIQGTILGGVTEEF